MSNGFASPGITFTQPIRKQTKEKKKKEENKAKKDVKYEGKILIIIKKNTLRRSEGMRESMSSTRGWPRTSSTLGGLEAKWKYF